MAITIPPDRAYLIRCWQERNGSNARRWRFSVEEVLHERKRRGFADLASLVDYLRTELGGEEDATCDDTAGTMPTSRV